MTLEQRIIALAQAMGADIKAAALARGDLAALTTTAKASLVAAINELQAAVDALGSGGSAVIDDNAGDGEAPRSRIIESTPHFDAIADDGVDCISIGGLTKHVHAIDFSLKLGPPPGG